MPGHVGLQMPCPQQRFSDAPELGHVAGGIDGPDLGLNNELATEITIQHDLDAMLQNVKWYQREAWPVFRIVPLPVAQASPSHRATRGLQPHGLARPSATGTSAGQATNPGT